MRQTLGCSLLLLACFLSLPAANAGPVARELKARGAEVGTPDRRPERASKQKVESKKNPVTTADKAQSSGGATVPQSSLGPSDSEQKTAESVPAPPDGCLADLQTIAKAVAGEQPEVEDKACTIPNPVILQETLGEKPVVFSKGLLLDCPFARRLARFVRDTVQPLARHHMGHQLTHILSGKGFVCRRRNNSPVGKLSEHAFGNATDWVSFRFADKSRLNVVAADQMARQEAEFFNAVRTAACGSFTTVLGPGSNAAHATHLHFDLGRTKKGKKNPYRICE